MAVFNVKADLYFEDGQALAQWMVDNSKVISQQSAIVGGLSAEERQSYCFAFQLVPAGDPVLVDGWHMTAGGPVDGLPVADAPGGDPVAAPAWVQPQGAHDAYPLGARVTHNGSTWENTGSAANTWEPGTFGWVVV